MTTRGGIKGNDNLREKLRKVFKQTRILFADKRYSVMHLRFLVLYIAVLNIYILAMFNQSMLQGSTFTIGGIFGSCEVIGILLGDRIIDIVPDHIASICITVTGLICTTILKLTTIS